MKRIFATIVVVLTSHLSVQGATLKPLPGEPIQHQNLLVDGWIAGQHIEIKKDKLSLLQTTDTHLKHKLMVDIKHHESEIRHLQHFKASHRPLNWGYIDRSYNMVPYGDVGYIHQIKVWDANKTEALCQVQWLPTPAQLPAEWRKKFGNTITHRELTTWYRKPHWMVNLAVLKGFDCSQYQYGMTAQVKCLVFSSGIHHTHWGRKQIILPIKMIPPSPPPTKKK